MLDTPAQLPHPGNKVPESGIYTVVHDREHYQAHDVTCIKGRKFPPCRECGDGVQFKLREAAQHIRENTWFKRRNQPNWMKEAAKGLGTATEK